MRCRRRGQIVAAVLLAAGSCGYSVGYGASRKYGIRSVSVQTVENDTYRQGLDRLLTRRLARDLTQYTGLVPGGPDTADAKLVVRLRDVVGRSVSEIGGGAILEGAVVMAAEVKLVDRRTGETMYENRHIDWAEFRSPVGETLGSAFDESAGDLSRAILSALDRSFAPSQAFVERDNTVPVREFQRTRRR